MRGVAPRIDFYGMVSNGTKAAGFHGQRRRSGCGKQPRICLPHVVSGRDLDPKPAGEVEALIGVGLAKSMNVKVGDGLTILAMTSDGALNGVDVQIVGIVNPASPNWMPAICASPCPRRSACCKAIASPTWWLAWIPPKTPTGPTRN